MTLHNPFKQKSEFIPCLILLFIAFAFLLFGNFQAFNGMLLTCFITFFVICINLAFIKNISNLNQYTHINHVFIQNPDLIQYANGVPLATGKQYSHSLEQKIQVFSYKGLLFGVFVEEKTISQQRIFIQELKNNTY
jgi:hypothetical protein